MQILSTTQSGVAGEAVFTSKFTFTAADLIGFGAVCTPLLPAPGPNTFYELLDITVRMLYGGVAFTGGSALLITSGTGSTWGTLANAAAFNPAANIWCRVAGGFAQVNLQDSNIVNQPIGFAMSGANYAAGNSTFVGLIRYRITTLG